MITCQCLFCLILQGDGAEEGRGTPGQVAQLPPLQQSGSPMLIPPVDILSVHLAGRRRRGRQEHSRAGCAAAPLAAEWPPLLIPPADNLSVHLAGRRRGRGQGHSRAGCTAAPTSAEWLASVGGAAHARGVGVVANGATHGCVCGGSSPSASVQQSRHRSRS